MSGLEGTGAMVRFNLRRDRIVVPVCVLAVVGLVMLTASSLDRLYPTRSDRERAATTIADNPAVTALRGVDRGLESLGGLVAFQTGVVSSVIVALISLLVVVRHTRGDEETGRTELFLASAVGRYAPANAAIGLVAAVDCLIGVAVALGLIGYGLPVAGSVALGAWLGGVGLVFAAVAAVAAQLSESRRTAAGLAVTVLGICYALRAAADAGGPRALAWLSPIGWGQAMRPFASERWWPLLLSLAAASALAATAYRLLAFRDLGAGLLPPRPGPAAAAPGLLSPLGLALRLQRAGLIGWSAGLFVLGLLYGSIAENVREFVEDSEQLGEIIAQAAGGSLVDSFLATAMTTLALVASGFTIQSVLRLRGEEGAGRAELVLAAAVSRWRWAASHLTVALAGTLVLLAAAGLGVGLADALRTGEPGELPRLLGSALAQAPATWVLAAVAVAAVGLAPRAAPLAWAALAACAFVGLFGAVLGIPRWLIDASPYGHVPQVPAVEVTAGPLIALTAIAAALTAAGLGALRRRDLA